MLLRPIKPEERKLIAHLLTHVKNGRQYTIPEEVEALGEYGLQLSHKGEHTLDLVEASFKDEDRREVFITLTVNQHKELYELDIWKTDFSSLKQYPTPDKIVFSEE